MEHTMTSSRDETHILNQTNEESKTTSKALSFPLSVKNYRCLPEKFSLEDIKPILTKEKFASLKKIYDLWCDGVDLEIYGSFVVQCGMTLVGKTPTNATDIDVASTITPLKDYPKIFSQLSAHGFKEKKLQTKPLFASGFHSYEFNDNNANIDFTVRLPDYDKSTPNALLLSEISMKFVKSASSTIYLQFDKRQFLLEHYCNHSMYPLATPHINERGVMRRILKQIKNNKHLYDHGELHMCYKRQKIEKFTKDDVVWKKITDLLKHDLKKKIGTKKFMSYFNEMSRMIKEHTFCIPEATMFIENFCAVVIEHHYKKLNLTNKNAQAEAINMTAILQNYFANHELYADKLPEIINSLLCYSNKLQCNDTNTHAELVSALEKMQPYFNNGYNKNRLFTTKAENTTHTNPSRSIAWPSVSLRAR